MMILARKNICDELNVTRLVVNIGHVLTATYELLTCIGNKCVALTLPEQKEAV